MNTDYLKIALAFAIGIFVALLLAPPTIPEVEPTIILFGNYYAGEEVAYGIAVHDNLSEARFKRDLLFFGRARRVYNKSKEIGLSSNKSFDEVYEEFAPIFQERYTQEIDIINGGEYEEYIQTIQELVTNNYSGDCDDFAMFFFVIARKLGEEVRYVVGHSDFVGHAWIQIHKEGKWIDYQSTGYLIGEDAVSPYYSDLNYMQ